MAAPGVMIAMAGRLSRLLPPATLLAGVILFGIGLLALGIEALGEDPRPLEASTLTSSNGTAALGYPTKYFGSRSDEIHVSYAFPLAPGDAYVVHCEDMAAIRRGEAPQDPLLAFTQLRSGAFVLSDQTLPLPSGPRFSVDPRTGVTHPCELAVVFTWTITGGDPTANRPTADVALHRSAFDAGAYWLLLVGMTGGALLALLGGLSWTRARATRAQLPRADDSPIELLRASLDRMGEQLERTRRPLLIAGGLGVFLWYPILIPWTWRQAARTSDHPLFPWAVSGLTLAFLLVLTALWARELHRIDHELLAWRSRMGELRDREAELLETLRQGR